MKSPGVFRKICINSKVSDFKSLCRVWNGFRLAFISGMRAILVLIDMIARKMKFAADILIIFCWAFTENYAKSVARLGVKHIYNFVCCKADYDIYMKSAWEPRRFVDSICRNASSIFGGFVAFRNILAGCQICASLAVKTVSCTSWSATSWKNLH